MCSIYYIVVPYHFSCMNTLPSCYLNTQIPYLNTQIPQCRRCRRGSSTSGGTKPPRISAPHRPYWRTWHLCMQFTTARKALGPLLLAFTCSLWLLRALLLPADPNTRSRGTEPFSTLSWWTFRLFRARKTAENVRIHRIESILSISV